MNGSRHRVALQIQDAGNLRAIAREFVEVVDDAARETRSTTATWSDPAVRLFAAKIAELCGIGLADPDVYGAAHEECQQQHKMEVH